MKPIVAGVAAVMVISLVSIVADNNTDARTRGEGNDSNSIVEPGSPGNDENAKSGINTTVCGPDAAHACQTSSRGE
jgi:hypothetical protein